MGIIGVLVIVVGLLISVALHECGHMIPAKKFGVYVPEFAVGFGPQIFGVKKGRRPILFERFFWVATFVW